MNKAGNNEQFDIDILQCKADILRARNIVPLHNNTTPKNPVAQDSSIETARPSDTAEISAKIPPPPGMKEQAEPSEETSDIPIFDLAEEIMAEQRKIIAIKRKAPGQKTDIQRLKPETRIDDHIIEQPKPLLSEQDKIIAEIVAKDIEKLCRDNFPGEQRL
ncbi:MAG: hypothetical protein PHQ35_00280 [Phycisphaerae bacterium]|nr:hypothetical protein [Phycisphaerae bacterium]MDD5381664.1 hypothetical protein [Phycisphaerae bacterium]